MTSPSASLQAKLAELHRGHQLFSGLSSSASLVSESRLTEDGDPTSPGGGGVRVVVRCHASPSLNILAEHVGRDKVSLKVDVPKEAYDQAGCGEEAFRYFRGFRCNAFLGPQASQADVFEEASAVVEHVMRGGGNGSLLCHGARGSGKTYTMFGPQQCTSSPAAQGSPSNSSSALGLVQRTAMQIFEYIRDRSVRGDIFALEASFVQLSSNPANGEDCIMDLLAESDGKLRAVPDETSPGSYVCKGAHRSPVRSPDDLLEAFAAGLQCSEKLAASDSKVARSHNLLIIWVESMVDHEGTVEPKVHQGKLVLGDLASSDACFGQSPVERQMVQVLDRQFASLLTLGSRTGSVGMSQDCALALLLRDCFGCERSRGLVVANIKPSPEALDETVRTLRYAQQLTSLKAVSGAGRIRTDCKSSSLLQMKQRHAECLRIMQEHVEQNKTEESEQKQRLQKEMDELNHRLVTKEKAQESLTEMQTEQLQKIDEVREEMAKTMTQELSKMRHCSMQEFNGLKQSVEQLEHHSSSQAQRTAEEHEARIAKMQAELQEALRDQRKAEDEASELRVKLASVEERAKMLHDRQEELRRERQQLDDERKELRSQSEQQWQKLMGAESELQRFRTESQAQKDELTRLAGKRQEEEVVARRERDAWRSREQEMQQELLGLQRQVDEAKREAELQALRSSAEQREAMSALERQVERLKDETGSKDEQLLVIQASCTKLEMEKVQAWQREDELMQRSARDIQKLQDEVSDYQAREVELSTMLHELQANIIGSNVVADSVDMKGFGPVCMKMDR